MQVIERKHAKGSSFEMQFDSKNMLLLVVRNDEAPSFAIGWLLNGRWCYQPLMWSCRAGRKFWFRPLIEFYRYIRKNKITDHNLRFLAWGENRLKHGGYVVGSESYRKWKAIGDRLAESRKRAAGMNTGCITLTSSPTWGKAIPTALNKSELLHRRFGGFLLRWTARLRHSSTGQHGMSCR